MNDYNQYYHLNNNEKIIDKPLLILKEYGRNVQKLVNYVTTIEDKNGTTVTPAKQIKLTDNKQRLHITLTRIEATAYIKNDSGNSTEVINSITTIYKKRAVQ